MTALTHPRNGPRNSPGKNSPGPRYFRLVHEFPLRPIQDAAQQRQAMEVAARLAAHAEGSLSPGQQDYLDALTVLLEDYDRRHSPAGGSPGSRPAPLDLLRHLVADHGLSVSALGRIIGSQPNASLILAGKRPISRQVAAKLAAHFALEPAAFL